MRLAAVCAAIFVLSGNPVAAQYSSADFVGTWELASIEARSESGNHRNASSAQSHQS